MWSYRDLFLLGAGVPAAGDPERHRIRALFGTTWFVNALVFAGVLLAVLAAVEFTRRVRTPRWRSCTRCSSAALALSWLVPSSALLR